MFTSPHPKISAIIGLLLAIGLNVKAMIDGDPTTNPDWSTVLPLIIVCIGLFSARQNGVTSEQVMGPAAVAQAAQDSKKP